MGTLAKMKIKLKESVSGVATEKEVLYNPAKMTYTKTIPWTGKDKENKVLPSIYNTAGRENRELDMELYFDYTMESEKKFIDDFKYFEAITSEHDISGEKRPPKLMILWGENSSDIHFSTCVITSMTWTYELFDKKGNILRATLGMKIQETA